MALKVFRIPVSMALFIIPNLVEANEIAIDSCYENSGSYQVIDCFNKKIEKAKINLDEQRALFVDKNNKFLDDKNKFNKKEANIHKKWLLFLNEDCEMRSFHAGEKDSLIYQIIYSECVLDRYVERTDSLKTSIKLI